MIEPPDTRPQYRLQPSLHPAYARLLCAFLRRSGFGWPEILAGTQLDADRLQSTGKYLSLAQITRLLRRATQLTGRSWLGYEVGRITTLSTHGVFGHTAISAPDVRGLFDIIHRFVRLRFTLLGIHFEPDGSDCVVRVHELQDWGAAVREFILLIILATITQLLETTAADSVQPIEIEWPLPKPAPPVYPERLVDTRIVYDAPRFGLRIPGLVLDLPCLMADEALYRKGLLDCETQLNRLLRGSTTSARVYALLLEKAPAYPQLEETACLFATSRRTLMRHLETEGTSYQTLLDEARKELAAWYLLETRLPITHIAERVGYEDPSNFSRTIRRWFGMAPLEIRRAR